MTKAKAATVAEALTNADIYCQTLQQSDGGWVVHARPPSGLVSIDVVKAFQDAQEITAQVESVVFS